jgi:hypothetical protein
VLEATKKAHEKTLRGISAPQTHAEVLTRTIHQYANTCNTLDTIRNAAQLASGQIATRPIDG